MMNNKFLFSLIFILLTFVGTKCGEEPDVTLIIANNSNKTLVFLEKIASYKSLVDFVGDTLLDNQSPFFKEIIEKLTVLPNDQIGLPLESKNLSNRVYRLYLFDREVIENEPWERIRDEYLVLRRYDLTLDSLKKINFRISYP